MRGKRASFAAWGTSRSVLLTVAIATLIAVAFSLYWVSPARADHESWKIDCPDPITEGDSGQIVIRRPGYRVVHAYIFTHEGAYTAGPDDFVEYHGVKFESGSNDRNLRVPIETKEDSIPEHDEQFAIGFMTHDAWLQCMVTIVDDDAPEVAIVEISTLPADGWAYRAGETLDVVVDMDSKVDVEGTPLISIYVGDEEGNSWRGARYHSGSGTRSLVFRYTVQPQDVDMGGIGVGAAASADDRSPAYGFVGNIYAAGTKVPIDYGHNGLKDVRDQRVDGRPYVQRARITSCPPDGWDAYRVNEIIEFTLEFNTDVVVEGETFIEVLLGWNGKNWDEALRHAHYERGSGSDQLVFGYTVQPLEFDDDGIGIAMGLDLSNNKSGFGGTGTIRGKDSGVERNPFYRGKGSFPGHIVDAIPPMLLSLEFVSRPQIGESYGVGESIEVLATFDEEVIVYGEPYVELDVGGQVRLATLRSGQEGEFSEALVFKYVVQAGDTDNDGIGIGANRVFTNEGGVFDHAGIGAGLEHVALAANPEHKVETQVGS